MSSEASYRPDWHSPTIRGGVLLMTVSALWIPISRNSEMQAFDWFMWVASLWIMFPLGAFLGGWLMRRLNFVALPRAIVLGAGLGLLTGVVLTGLMVGLLKADALIGLVKNAGGGGYESYRFSVLKNLRELTWSIGKGIVPVMTVTLLAWAIVKHRRGQATSLTGADAALAAKFPLRLTGWHAVWWLGMAVVLAVMTGAMMATHNGGIKQTLLGMLGGAGVTVIGPWVGPMINSSGGNTFALPAFLIALPFLILSLLPFALKLSVHRRAAAIYWCIYITVVLAWTCLGVFSAGMSMG